MGVKCFMVTETSNFRAQLRRYVLSENDKCPAGGYHNADGPQIAVIPGIQDAEGYWDLSAMEKGVKPPRSDSRWPVKCDRCAYQFTAQDEYQLFCEHVYIDFAGTEYTLRNPVPGMMWYADWYGDYMRGPDGHSLMVVCPDGSQWCIDSRASNCTLPTDAGAYGVAHRCWIRHGTPPNITVDKAGKTCAAGAGSIAVPGYHGFLRNGEFT